MTAMTLSVRCPDCGPLPILLDGIVVVHVNTDERATFVCPRCSVPASMSLHPALVPELVDQGVPYAVLPPQPEPRLRGELTDTEIDRYVREMRSATYLAWLAAMA